MTDAPLQEIPENPPDGFELQLLDPIQWGSENIDRLKFRTPTFGDVEGFPVGSGQEAGGLRLKMGDFTPLIARITGRTADVVKRLSIRDGVRAMEVASNVLGPRLAQTSGGK